MKCLGPKDPKQLFSDRCLKPATHQTLSGPRCDGCAEDLRRSMRDPNTLGNLLCGGVARTEEQIALLVRPLPN